MTLNFSCRVSDDHQVVEFPLHLLPPDVFVGCVIDVAFAICPNDQKDRLRALQQVFEDIEQQASSEAAHTHAMPYAYADIDSTDNSAPDIDDTSVLSARTGSVLERRGSRDAAATLYESIGLSQVLQPVMDSDDDRECLSPIPEVSAVSPVRQQLSHLPAAAALPIVTVKTPATPPAPAPLYSIPHVIEASLSPDSGPASSSRSAAVSAITAYANSVFDDAPAASVLGDDALSPHCLLERTKPFESRGTTNQTLDSAGFGGSR